jgi:uncharacterized protein YfaS (alpha-2-macroglobulin family)
LNRKILIAIIVIVAVSIAGTVVLNVWLANNNGSQFRGTLVFQSDIAGVAVTVLGPEETLKTGVTGANGEVSFTGLPEGDYQAIAVKDGYTSHYMMGTSINHALMGGRTTVPINMVVIPDEQPLYVSASPGGLVIKQGSSGTAQVTVTSLKDYAGAVSLNCMQLPSGVTAAFDPPSVTLNAGGSTSTTLTLTVSSTATKGIYAVDIELSTEQLGTGGFGLLLQVS